MTGRKKEYRTVSHGGKVSIEGVEIFRGLGGAKRVFVLLLMQRMSLEETRRINAVIEKLTSLLEFTTYVGRLVRQPLLLGDDG